jgi:hypothetical protein
LKPCCCGQEREDSGEAGERRTHLAPINTPEPRARHTPMTLSVEFFLASVDDAVAVAAVVIALAAADNVAVRASVVDMLRD